MFSTASATEYFESFDTATFTQASSHTSSNEWVNNT